MAQIPVIVDENVFSPVKFCQERHAWRMTGPYPVKKMAFFQLACRDRANGLIYSGRNLNFLQHSILLYAVSPLSYCFILTSGVIPLHLSKYSASREGWMKKLYIKRRQPRSIRRCSSWLGRYNRHIRQKHGYSSWILLSSAQIWSKQSPNPM